MKKIMLIIGCMLMIWGAQAQKQEWKEMKDFHAVMSKSFHPTEKNDFAPLKANAALLVQKAIAWRQSAVPAGYDQKLSKKYLKKLVKAVKEVEKDVKKGATDAELKEEIMEAHEVFHTITEKCTTEDHPHE